MAKLVRKIGALAGAVIAISLLGAAQAGAQADGPSARYNVVPVAEGLDHPWSLTFMPDGSMLIVELSGHIRVMRDGSLAEEPVAGVPEVYFESQGGLFDVVLDPDFADNSLVYLSYAHGTPDSNWTRVARARFDGEALTDLTVIFDATPAKDTPVHYGGRIAFLPDETMLVTVGDGFDYREEAQNLGSHLGKIVRIDRDGNAPADNPFVGREGALPEIWSYGHRNQQGLVHDAASGLVYEHEHGAQGGDEINVIEPGKNYGWPVITRGIDYSGARISPFTEYEGMEQAIVDWTPSIAPAGMTIYRGDAFPDWQGDIFAGALAAQNVHRVKMENGEPAGEEVLFAELGKRIRDVRSGPDGFLYLVTDGEGGSVLRVTPAP